MEICSYMTFKDIVTYIEIYMDLGIHTSATIFMCISMCMAISMKIIYDTISCVLHRFFNLSCF